MELGVPARLAIENGVAAMVIVAGTRKLEDGKAVWLHLLDLAVSISFED